MTLDDLTKWIGCDQCGSAQALYLIRFVNHSDIDTVGGLTSNELAFCGHHFNKNKEALDKFTLEIIQLNKEEEALQLEEAEV
jgi:hypothetical protein